MFHIRYQELMYLTFPHYFSDLERQPLSEELKSLMEPKCRTRTIRERFVTYHSRYFSFQPIMNSLSFPVDGFIDNLSADIFGIRRAESIGMGICINCREPALAMCHSSAGEREFKVSGLCEPCFHDIMGEN